MKKTVFSKIFSTVAIMTMVFAMVPFQVAHATGSENVVGYAFSDMPDGSDQNKPCTGIDPTDANNEHCGRGLGWISLNSINNGWAVNYGVNLNRATGNFEGYGYADNGGLVIFNPTGPFPSGPGTVDSGAKVDRVCLTDVTRTCKVTGWIRFISARDEDPDTAGFQGWDGWVSLSGTGYGLELDKPDTNGVRKFIGGGDHYAWGSWIVGWVDFSYASVIQDMCLDIDDVQTSVPADRNRDVFGNCPPKEDICKTTYFNIIPSDPRNGTPDPKTTPPYQDTLPPGYTISPDSSKCGIWACTIKGYPQYNAGATISDNSLCQCPAGKTFIDGQCKGTTSDPDICPSTIPYGGTTYDPKTVGDQTQSDIDAMGYSVKPPLPAAGAKCGIFGCKDLKADNYSSTATIADNSCTYISCPPNNTPPVNGHCPGDICRDGIDQFNNNLKDQEDPKECPVKGPKQPVYCETGGRNCPTGGVVQP